jgi:formylglycine-generating enzyme required for sulfatase activity
MKAGRRYRLPTEAEWEYACRAGTDTPFFFGDRLKAEQANFDGRFEDRTCKVGSYAPNAWGLFDMHGNVWEWCQDGYREDYYYSGPNKDPQGPEKAENRVLRGGSWADNAANCRSARRFHNKHTYRGRELGFRVVLVRD